MNKLAHRIYIYSMIAIVIAISIYLFYIGKSYYQTSIEERFYHAAHKSLKPSGPFGHGLGITGTLMMVVGVFGYQARKYMKVLSNVWLLKHWLEFHIFLCTLGPILVLFHTSFKFGGLVAISFWSMMAVVASGVVGRYIYLQIPRSIHGKELSLNEIRDIKTDYSQKVESEIGKQRLEEILSLTQKEHKSNILFQYFSDWQIKNKVKKQLIISGFKGEKLKNALALVKTELNMNRKIDRLVMMQKLFHYWHVIHLPFAIIMLVIMLIHVGVTITFGYKWVF